MDAGRIVAQGSQTKLMRYDGLYWQLAMVQFAA